MKIFISLLSILLFVAVMGPANTVQPDSDATLGGKYETRELEEMNPSVNPVPETSESETFHGSTIQKESEKPKPETLNEGSEMYQHDGYYRKGL